MCNMLEDENGGAECWRGTVLEPACGTGNFLVEILKRKLSIGMTETEAAETLFGIDILADNIEESIQRLTDLAPTAESIFRKNIVQGNFLKPEGIWFWRMPNERKSGRPLCISWYMLQMSQRHIGNAVQNVR